MVKRDDFAEVSTGSGSDRVSEIMAMEASAQIPLPGRYHHPVLPQRHRLARC
jgi:hypothetical protein